mmetsp:Transcript_20171/g.56803  ORF Transcript_20171/g.56803 Transcript_20171/m.56803 type:complete len:325 (-) Transcript_20171:347-1321(-)
MRSSRALPAAGIRLGTAEARRGATSRTARSRPAQRMIAQAWIPLTPWWHGRTPTTRTVTVWPSEAMRLWVRHGPRACRISLRPALPPPPPPPAGRSCRHRTSSLPPTPSRCHIQVGARPHGHRPMQLSVNQPGSFPRRALQLLSRLLQETTLPKARTAPPAPWTCTPGSVRSGTRATAPRSQTLTPCATCYSSCLQFNHALHLHMTAKTPKQVHCRAPCRRPARHRPPRRPPWGAAALSGAGPRRRPPLKVPLSGAGHRRPLPWSTAPLGASFRRRPRPCTRSARTRPARRLLVQGRGRRPPRPRARRSATPCSRARARAASRR